MSVYCYLCGRADKNGECYPVYLKCRPDKLTSQIYATFKNGQYNYLAEYALAGSAFFVAENSENTMFDKLRSKKHKAEYVFTL